MTVRVTERASATNDAWLMGVLTGSAVVMLLAGSAQAQLCTGDCDGDGSPSVAERQVALEIALGGDPLAACSASDADLDGAVRVPDLTRATVASLSGCAAAAAGQPRGGGQVVVQIGTANGLPGQTAPFDVTLDDGGEPVAGVQVDIGFQPQARVLANAQGRPTCAVNPAIDKEASAYAFQPPGCSGAGCTAMRALVLSFSNVDPIPDGSVMFTCTVQIAPSAPNGVYPLTGSNAGASDPTGNALFTIATDGAVIVGPALPTNTPTPPTGVQGSLILKRARLRADTSNRPGVDKGTVLIDGVVNTNDPFGGLIDDIVASGLSVRVQTAAGVDVLLDWEAPDCDLRPSARGPRISCARETGGVRRSVSFRPVSTPNLFIMKLQARGLGFQPPLSADPVQVSLATASLVRGDDLDGCEVRGSRGQVESCREVGVQPTKTLTPSVTSTATPTATATSTVTLTPSVTATPTVTRTPTETGTPTPVVVPSVALGTRAFSIEPGSGFSSPDFTGTGLFTTALSGQNEAFSFTSGPLLIDGGLPDADGIAPLSLQQDALIGITLFDERTVCLKLLAAGSGGSIDCDGGTAYDVEASQPAGDVGSGFTVQTGLGAPAGPGDGVLIVQQQVQTVPGFFVDCATVTFTEPAQTWAYTTTAATATKGALQLTVAGEPFDCNTWTTTGSGGRLAAPAPGTEPIGDVARVYRLAEAPAELGTHLCTLAPGPSASHLEINTALGAPLVLPLGGELELSFGAPGFQGQTFSACNIVSIDPIDIPGIGVVCLTSSFGCGSSTMDCDGGLPLGIDLRSNGNAGSCADPFDCFDTCSAYCFSQGLFNVAAGCTGFCSFNSTPCEVDADCQPFSGVCNGPEPVGANANICQCTCESLNSGSGSRPGELQCFLGASLVVESSAPCDGFDPLIVVGDACLAVSTAPVTDLFINANFTGDQIPFDGEAVNEGLPLACDTIRDTGVSGLAARGAVNFFATTLGDLAVELFATCQ